MPGYARPTAILLATEVVTEPVGDISATDLQGALSEIASEKSPTANPTFTGTVSAPTASVGTNTTQIATTAFVNSEISNDAIGKNGLQILTMASGASIATTGQVNTFQILQNTASSDSFITFHIANDYAAHFGIDGTTNDLSYGGWSAGANKYRVWHAGNQTTLFTSPSLTGTPTAPTATAGTSTTQIATTQFVQTAISAVTLNTQTASYSLVLSDAGKVVEMNVATANNLTIPLNSSQAFPIGTSIDIVQYGTGQTTIVATGGVTIRSRSGNLKLSGQYSSATLYKRGTDEWVVFGDLIS